MAIVENGVKTHEGLVLAKRERNYYDDSDFVALVWNPDKEAIVETCYASTRYAGGGYAEIDATPDVVKAAGDFMVARLTESLLSAAANIATDPCEVGREVRVVSGRKYKGVTGTVKRKWERRSAYDTWSYGWRLLLATEQGEVWVDADKCEVVDPWEYMPTRDEMRAEAEQQRGNFRAFADLN